MDNINDTANILKLEERVLTGIELGESHFREFKSAYQRRPSGEMEPRPIKDIGRDIGEALVSFSNADGGELLVGVEDDGKITGIPHKGELQQAMEKAYKNYVHNQTPIFQPVVRIIEMNNNKILYFRVSKSTEYVHLTSDGRCLQRFDRENRPVPAERIQMDRQEKLSLEYDRQFILNASLKELDLEEIEKVIKHLALGYSAEKFLQIFDLAEYSNDGLKLKRAALLLFAKNVIKWHPRCAVRILRVRGTEIGTGHDYNVSEDDTISGNIITILERAWDALRPHLARTKFQTNALFRESIIYPEEACRETLINAIAHRDYSIEGKPVEILVYDDRMEVRSPGRLLSSISVEDLKELKGTHQSRNVFIARLLRELGYMREMGEGIRRIYSSMRASELVDPEIFSDQNSFVVTLFYKSVFSPKDVQWLSGFSDFRLSKNEQRVVLLGRDGNPLSTNDITQTLEIVDTKDFTRLYQRLNLKGIIYNTRPGVSLKRSMPRFQIRPPNEAQQYLEELERALFLLGPVNYFNKDTAANLKAHLSMNSPFKSNTLASLRALEYLSESNTPLPRASSIWDISSTSRNGFLQPASKLQSAKTKTLIEADWKFGNILSLTKERGFGFAVSDDGEEFFLHISNIIRQQEWQDFVEGSRIKFKPGERSLSKKRRTARDIMLHG